MSSEELKMQDLSEAVGLKVPRILLPLINEPLRHTPIANPYSPNPRGILTMTFDGQVFRKDIEVPYYSERCGACGQNRPAEKSLQERYSLELARKCEQLGVDLYKAIEKKLVKALKELP